MGFQTLLLGDLLLPLTRVFLTVNQISPYSKFIGLSSVAVLIILIIYNYKKYNDKYAQLKLVWENETTQQRVVRGIFLILSLIIPWIPIVLLGIRHK